MATKKKRVKPRTCDEALDIVITQDVLDKNPLPWKELGSAQHLREVRIIDGKHVALVGVVGSTRTEAAPREEPYMKCACDFYRATEGNCTRLLVSTFQCTRKKAWEKERLKQVGDDYRSRNVSLHDALLDLCDRVWNKGEYVGQSVGTWLSVQHVAEMFGVSDGAVLTVVGDLRDEQRLNLDGMVLIPYLKQDPDIQNNEHVPMVSWEHEDPSAVPNLVWAAKIDGRFQIEVQRKNSSYRGVLCIFDHDVGDILLHSFDVGLSYDATFGPDVDDVARWESLVAEFIAREPKK